MIRKICILSNSAKCCAGQFLLPAYNFSATMVTTYSTYPLRTVACLKFLAIETMTPLFNLYLLRQNGWTDKDTTWYAGRPRRLGPCDIVLDGDPAPSPRIGAEQPLLFGPLLWLAAGGCRGNPTGTATRLVCLGLRVKKP